MPHYASEMARRRMPKEQFEALALSLAQRIQPGVTITGGTQSLHILIRMRGEFVQSYCREKGWDAEKLTAKQIIEIRNQSGWRNPNA